MLLRQNLGDNLLLRKRYEIREKRLDAVFQLLFHSRKVALLRKVTPGIRDVLAFGSNEISIVNVGFHIDRRDEVTKKKFFEGYGGEVVDRKPP